MTQVNVINLNELDRVSDDTYLVKSGYTGIHYNGTTNLDFAIEFALKMAANTGYIYTVMYIDEGKLKPLGFADSSGDWKLIETEFQKHLRTAEKIVSKWPAWKRNALGPYLHDIDKLCPELPITYKEDLDNYVNSNYRPSDFIYGILTNQIDIEFLAKYTDRIDILAMLVKYLKPYLNESWLGSVEKVETHIQNYK